MKKRRKGKSLNDRFATPAATKVAVVDLATNLMRDRYDSRAHPRACLYWAHTTIEAAAQHGIQLVLQAGTANYPRIRPEDDDGVRSTHFSYEWQGLDDPTTRERLAAGLLPEMHVWCADVKRQQVVDLTAGYQHTLCVTTAGLSWDVPPLPRYIWAPAQNAPRGVLYRPDRDATLTAALLWKEKGDGKP